MAPEVLFDSVVHVHYGYFEVHADDGFQWEADTEFIGQSNGLCGAAVHGLLHLVTGLHTGAVGLRVERHETEPPVGDVWEDIVEVSFASDGSQLVISAFQEQHSLTLPAGDYRVRYSCRGMDQARETDTRTDPDPLDTYLLQLWPATTPARPDEILRRTSATADYWHRVATGVDSGADGNSDRKMPTSAADPRSRLRAMNSVNAGFLERLDDDLALALAGLDAGEQQAVARWAALRGAERAGLAALSAFAPAITALRAGEPVPPPFGDDTHVWSLIDAVPRTVVRRPPSGDRDICPQDWAAAGLFRSVNTDTLAAAYDALVGATGSYGMQYLDLIAAARATFAGLRT